MSAVIFAAWRPETDGAATAAALQQLAAEPALDEQLMRSAAEGARREVHARPLDPPQAACCRQGCYKSGSAHAFM